jgi:adenylate kinase
MRLLLIGAPGSGKGTQADLLASRFGIAHISSGDLLRQHVREQTAFGQLVKKYVDKGDLVPDSLVMDILRKPVLAATNGYVLDGFPRPELVRRLLARGRGADDTAEVIEHRLQVYDEMTVPLLDYYAGREWMFAVDGTQPPQEVHEDIVRRIQKLKSFTAPA